MKHTMDMDRLAALAADFGNPASRRQMMQEFGDYPNALSGANEDGEQTLISICPSSLIVKTFQENGWVRVNEYGADGQMAGETFDGRWMELPVPTKAEPEEELELSDAQLARNDEIYNGVHALCQMMAEDDALEWSMEIIGQIADYAAELLTSHGIRVRFPSVVTEPDGSQHIEEYSAE